MDDVQRAKKPSRMPLVFTKEEAQSILRNLEGTKWLMASLRFTVLGSEFRVYGSGWRVQESGFQVSDSSAQLPIDHARVGDDDGGLTRLKVGVANTPRPWIGDGGPSTSQIACSATDS
jgi:hypothetical protein